MSTLRFTRLPERGDAVLGDLTTGKPVFLKADSFAALSDIDLTLYEIIGVVAGREGDKVLVAYKDNAAKKWSERYSYKLTMTAGATSGTLTIRQASDSWAAGHDYTISGLTAFVDDAEGRATLVEELNAYFAENAPFTAALQDWVAEVVGSEVHLHFAFTDYRQASGNTASSGFAITANLAPDIPARGGIYRRSGAAGSEGAISNWARALSYFRQDISSVTYNPTSNVTSVKVNYPICLPGYLGQSSYRKDGDTQLDYCAFLRGVYGDGEQGWLKFMASFIPVKGTDYAAFSLKTGKDVTRILSTKTYTSQAQQTAAIAFPAANYCAGVGTTVMPRGSWYLPCVKELMQVLEGIQYNVVNDRKADILNATLQKLGATAISNGSHFWSASRGSAGNALNSVGTGGYFYNGYFCGASVCVPVSLIQLA